MTPPSRSRIGWWLYVAGLVVAVLFVAYSFVGVLVLGLFGYYATRPVCDRFERVVGSERRAATLTVLVVLLPTLLLVLYAAARTVQQVRRLLAGSGAPALASRIGGLEVLPASQRARLASVLRAPLSSVDALTESAWSNLQLILEFVQAALGTLVLLGLALTLAYGFLSRADALSDALVELFGGRDTTAYAYAAAVDDDLESVFFGNFLFVLLMSVVAAVTYGVTNAVAPEGLQIPMVLVLGFLTGVASLVPIVVGKVVYLPVVGFLALRAARADGNQLPFVAGVLVVYFLVLDLLPQSIVQPYVSGRQFDPLLLLLAYLLGPILFGWYGFFLLPILFVLVFELVRIVLPELLHGEPVRPEPTIARDAGAGDDVGPNDGESADGTGADDEPGAGEKESTDEGGPDEGRFPA